MKFFLIPCDNNKRPLTQHGEKDASADTGQWDLWKRRWPGCAWAIATGPSGLIAVDEDCYKAVWTAGILEKAVGVTSLPDTVEWRSGRGGRVRLYKTDIKVTAKNGILPGVDIKAGTGYVLCPPSRNAEGQKYTWTRSPQEFEVAEAPKELVDWLIAQKAVKGAAGKPRATNTDGHEQVFLRGGDGRWEFVRRLGGLLRREGCGYDTIFDALRSFVEHQCEPDETLRDSELERLAGWLMSVPIGAQARFEEQLVEENGTWYATANATAKEKA